MIIFWIIVIALIVHLLREGTIGGRGKPVWHDGETALDILEKRYARGEIEKKEFEEKKKDLAKN